MPPLTRIAAFAIAIGAVHLPAGTSAGEATPASGRVRLFNSDFQLPPKSRWREERIMTAPKLKLSVDLGTDKNVKGSMSMLSREVIDIDVLTGSELRLNYIQSNRSSDIDFGNNRSHHTNPLPLDGATVLATRNPDGRWSTKLHGRRRPTADERSALHALTYLWSEGVYPDREVAIGETWKIDAGEFKNLFGSDFQKPSGDFEFKLARLVEHGGMMCAKITGKGKLSSQTKSLGGATGTGQTALKAAMDLSIDIYRSVELAMDLTIEMKGTLELSNEGDQDALLYKASSNVEFTRKLKKR